MKYAAITTCSDRDYEAFGKRMEKSFKEHWPIPLHRFSDNDLLYKSPWLDWFQTIPGKAFRGKIGNEYHYRYDAVKFSWKTAAIVDGINDIEADVVFWVDADTLTHSDVPMDFVESLLPENCYTACLQRAEMYPECGFTAFRKTHPAHEEFMGSWRRLYETCELFLLPEWHDSYIYNQIRLAYEGAGKFKSHNLSGPVDSMHPFVNSDLGKYMDHLKGPRKQLGKSTDTDLVVDRGEAYWQ